MKTELIKEQLASMGKSVKWLAEECGINANSASYIINRRRNPSRTLVRLMAKVLNRNPDEIYPGFSDKSEGSRKPH